MLRVFSELGVVFLLFEVGIVVASIGAAEGVVDAELFGVVVARSILTTLVAPFALRRLSRSSASPRS